MSVRVCLRGEVTVFTGEYICICFREGMGLCFLHVILLTGIERTLCY